MTTQGEGARPAGTGGAPDGREIGPSRARNGSPAGHSKATAERARRARNAAASRWAACADRSAATAPARAAAEAKLERELRERYGIDPAAPNYEKRLKSARSAHFARLALARMRGERGAGAADD